MVWSIILHLKSAIDFIKTRDASPVDPFELKSRISEHDAVGYVDLISHAMLCQDLLNDPALPVLIRIAFPHDKKSIRRLANVIGPLNAGKKRIDESGAHDDHRCGDHHKDTKNDIESDLVPKVFP